MKSPALVALTFSTFAIASLQADDRRAFVDAEAALALRFGQAWEYGQQARISAAIVEMAEALPVGGAIDLPCAIPSGTLDFRRVADRVQVTGGRDGRVIFGSGQYGLELMFSHLEQEIAPGVAREFTKYDPARPDR